MFKINNFEDNDDVKILRELGPFKVIEYQKDLSVNHATAQEAYYASQMNVRRRQVVCDVSISNITVQAGAMQWMAEGKLDNASTIIALQWLALQLNQAAQ